MQPYCRPLSRLLFNAIVGATFFATLMVGDAREAQADPSIRSLRLVNANPRSANYNKVVRTLDEETILDLATLQTRELTVEAIVRPKRGQYGSVAFTVNRKRTVDDVFPYMLDEFALGGPSTSNFSKGEYKITATLHYLPQGKGKKFNTVTAKLRFRDSGRAPPAAPTATTAPGKPTVPPVVPTQPVITPAAVPTPTPTATPLSRRVLALGLGFHHTCILELDGTVSCVGGNALGQLGQGTSSSALTFQYTKVPLLANVVGIGAGDFHSCALRSNGTVACWGINTNGQLGLGSNESPKTSPVDVPSITDGSSIETRGPDSCVIHRDSTVSCFGSNSSSELGVSGSPILSAVKIPGLVNVAQIEIGQVHSCVRTFEGTVICYGTHLGFDAAGLTPQQRISNRTPVPGLTSVVKIAVGGFHVCALTSSGEVYCWGKNESGQVGTGSGDPVVPNLLVVPQKVNLPPATDIGAGTFHSCALLADETIRCWGSNSLGNLGSEVLNESGFILGSSTVPVPVLLATTPPQYSETSTMKVPATDIFIDQSRGCASRVQSNLPQEVYCWGGGNIYGELGDGTDNYYLGAAKVR